MDKKNKARRTNPIEVYKYLRFTENAKSLAVEEEKKKNWYNFEMFSFRRKKTASENFQHFRFFDPLIFQKWENLDHKKFSILGSPVYACFEKSVILIKVSLYTGPQKSPKSPISIPHRWEAFLI